ncbi:UNKNOWN [Stylonychia lemnae]|uniref:Uncharacterized protein n=1 Tax=Stylonychia lemnae TaxID=5949 RepID=A0A078BCU4_STYLE|nr:UNKNOWN [Stylonychia lemnae]|eukprot:CDW91042.1 UNKNOWN [Stylonychia lemnae]
MKLSILKLQALRLLKLLGRQLSFAVADQAIYINEDPVKRLSLPTISYPTVSISCGAIIQTVTDDQNNILDPAIFTYYQSNNSITIFTKDKTMMAVSPITVKVENHLQDYTAIMLSYSFIVTLQIDCQFDYLTSSADISINYIVHDQQLLQLSNYIQSYLSPHCGTISTYTCQNEISLSDCQNNDLTIFNSITGAFRIQTYNINQVGTHQFLITGQLNSKQASQRVIITVTKDCRCAVITKSALPTLSFDINNGTKNYIAEIPWTNDMIALCPMTYKLIDSATNLAPINTVFNIIDNNQIQISVSSSIIPKQYSIIVTGFAHASVSSSETLSITITNLCPTSQITTQPIQDQEYITSDPIKSIQFDSWISSISYCTQLTYTVTFNGSSTTPNFIAFNQVT